MCQMKSSFRTIYGSYIPASVNINLPPSPQLCSFAMLLCNLVIDDNLNSSLCKKKCKNKDGPVLWEGEKGKMCLPSRNVILL